MMNKFFRHGTGSGARAINYLLQSNDHKGGVRAGIRVMRGDPERVAKLVDSLDFVHRYTSGVIAFHPDDEPTEDQVTEVLAEFERLAFAGLERDQYAFTVIEHVDSDGSKHYHTFCARVELRTGKSLNIAPPGWQKTYDHLVDHFNAKFGWQHPGDPNNARDVQPGFGVYQKGFADLTKSENVFAALDVDSHSRLVLADMIEQRVRAGIISNRADMISHLSEIGDITRQGKNYISVRLNGESKNTRLKGTLFHDDFDADAWLARSAKAEKPERLSVSERAAKRASRADPVAAEHSLERINECFRQRKKHNDRVYRAVSEQRQETVQQDERSFRKETEFTEVVDRQSVQGVSGDVDVATLKATEEDTVRFVDDNLQHIFADNSDGRGGSVSLVLHETAAEIQRAGTDRGSPAERERFYFSSSRENQGSKDRRQSNNYRVGRELDGNGFEHSTIENYRVRETIDRQDQPSRDQAGELDRASERKRYARSAVDRALEQFIRRADAAVAACRAARKNFDRSIETLQAVANKLRHFGGMKALQRALKAKRNFAKYGKIWKRQFTRKQRAEQLARQQHERTQARDLREVRPLHDHVVQEREPSAMSDPTR